MHPNPAYRGETETRNIAFVRQRAFGVLAVNAEAGPLLSHVPYLLNEPATHADLHLVRSNPIARQGSARAVIAVNGPDGYVSPDWYGVDDQVPTWNYVAVHLRGTLKPLPNDALRDMLDRQSAEYEARLLPKKPWMVSKVSADVLARLLRMIQPFRFHIENIDATWKLSQNKGSDQKRGASDSVADGFGSELDDLADLMRE